MLLRHAGEVVLRPEVSRQVLDRQLLPFDRSIDTHMSNLRRKLGPQPGGSGERIKTVRGVGYIYVLAPQPAPKTSRPERQGACKYLQPALRSL